VQQDYTADRHDLQENPAMMERTVTSEDAGIRLDVWLVRRGDAASRSRASTWLERGKVFVNGREAGLADAATHVAAGDTIGLWVDRPGSAKAGDRAVVGARGRLIILHEDAAIVVLDKPVGVIVEPLPDVAESEPTLLDLLQDHYRHVPRAKVHVVHRIDRDTSGLVLFARTAAARDHLKAQFERRTPERVYQAIVLGVMADDEATWEDVLAWDKTALRQRRAHGRDAGGKDAVANVRVRERFARATLIEVSLVTGKRNQIRVQAGLRGFPLLGERQYRFDAPPEPEGLPVIDRQALHAWRLQFVHPTTGRPVSFSSPPPEDFTRMLRALRNEKTR
jgi:23S rRNA pseudouridine1911/1915/1917 synthase